VLDQACWSANPLGVLQVADRAPVVVRGKYKVP
jgi:hypothetical protein